MERRLQLHQILTGILGSENVYFQTPESTRMKYPCIVYQRNAADTKFADDKPYLKMKRYTVTVIDKDPDSKIPDKIAALPLCTFNRHYTVDNLNHDIYNLYY